MRLTLRTMLAYMDDILEPSDHQQVGQKIEESEFATNLLHKIRDVTRRMRLGAPKVSGRGMGLDPNTVAEYLDNTLPGERVPDFEKVCLESDVHLAEAASCHQILTLVLGEPAEVDPALRRRMYDIVSESAGAEARTAASAAAVATPVLAAAGGPSSEAAPTPSKPRPEVPDYLRGGSRSRFWPVVGTLLAVCLLAVVVVSALGLDSNNPVIRWFYGNPKGPDTALNTPLKPAKNADKQNGTDSGKSVDNASKTPGADAKLPENAGANGTETPKAPGTTAATNSADETQGKSGTGKIGGATPVALPHWNAAGPADDDCRPAAARLVARARAAIAFEHWRFEERSRAPSRRATAGPASRPERNSGQSCKSICARAGS